MRKNIFLLSLFTFLLTASALRAGNFFRTDDSKILPDTLHVSGRSCNIQVGNLLFDRAVNNASDAVEVETTEASTITLSAGKGANFYCFILAIVAICTVQFGLLKTKEEKEGIKMYDENDEVVVLKK